MGEVHGSLPSRDSHSSSAEGGRSARREELEKGRGCCRFLSSRHSCLHVLTSLSWGEPILIYPPLSNHISWERLWPLPDLGRASWWVKQILVVSFFDNCWLGQRYVIYTWSMRHKEGNGRFSLLFLASGGCCSPGVLYLQPTAGL